MVRGLYTAYTGMANEQKRLDVISNNLANSATVGYKEENVTNQSFKQMLAVKIRDGSNGYADEPIGTMSLGVKIGETYMNWSQGSLRETDKTYDIAIEGKGFFKIKVMDKDGNEETMYTRNGQFTITSDGHIVDCDGNYLQGSGGDLQVPTDASDIAIKSDGSIYADGQLVDKIELADFEDYNYLELYGENMYRAVDGATPRASTATMLQGFTEQSNVNVVDEMVSMITITRAYEAGQKMIRTQDELLGKAVNDVGRV